MRLRTIDVAHVVLGAGYIGHAELVSMRVSPLSVHNLPSLHDPAWHQELQQQLHTVEKNERDTGNESWITAVNGHVCVEGLHSPLDGPIGQEMRHVLLMLQGLTLSLPIITAYTDDHHGMDYVDENLFWLLLQNDCTLTGLT